MKVFDWQRDELILALDVYLRMRPAAPGPAMPEVRDLSNLLQSATLHPVSGRPLNFRSPASVVMKLMNFRSIDPTYAGKGLAAGSIEDRQVWEDFSQDAERVSKTASTIRRLVANGEIAPLDQEIEIEGNEGRLLTRLHRVRERDEKLVKAKKTAVLKHTGRLACEICDFTFGAAYGSRGVDFIECHHVKPLSEIEFGRKTQLADLALVCANCHRMNSRKTALADDQTTSRDRRPPF